MCEFGNVKKAQKLEASTLRKSNNSRNSTLKSEIESQKSRITLQEKKKKEKKFLKTNYEDLKSPLKAYKKKQSVNKQSTELSNEKNCHLKELSGSSFVESQGSIMGRPSGLLNSSSSNQKYSNQIRFNKPKDKNSPQRTINETSIQCAQYFNSAGLDLKLNERFSSSRDNPYHSSISTRKKSPIPPPHQKSGTKSPVPFGISKPIGSDKLRIKNCYDYKNNLERIFEETDAHWLQNNRIMESQTQGQRQSKSKNEGSYRFHNYHSSQPPIKKAYQFSNYPNLHNFPKQNQPNPNIKTIQSPTPPRKTFHHH